MCMVTYSKSSEKNSSMEKTNDFIKLGIISPRWAAIEITTRCDHKCYWCYQKKSIKHGTIVDMDIKDFELILNILEKNGIKQVTLSGGEPTCHPYFKEILYIVSKFNKIIFHINSNGDNIDSKIIKVFNKSKIQQINFNFQGEKLHDLIHGKKCYKNLLETISIVKQNNIETVGTVVVNKNNLAIIGDIIKDMVYAGLDKIRTWDEVNYHFPGLSVKDIKKVDKISRDIVSKYGYDKVISYEPHVVGDIYVPCFAMHGLITIKADANITFCLDKSYNNIIGNILKDNFSYINEKLLLEINKYKKSNICPARGY